MSQHVVHIMIFIQIYIYIYTCEKGLRLILKLQTDLLLGGVAFCIGIMFSDSSLVSMIKSVTSVICLLFLLIRLEFEHLDIIHYHANKTCLVKWDKQPLVYFTDLPKAKIC